MSEKLKKSTGGKLLMRSGGLALSVPIVIFLGGVLLLINSLLVAIILGGLASSSAVVHPYIGILTFILVLSSATMFVLFRGVIRYMGGIGKLWNRLRGIQEERERVERLVEQQATSDDEILYAEDDNQSNVKYQ